MRGGVTTAMSIRVAVDDAVMDGVVVNGGNCSVREELPTVVPSPATGQIYVKGTEFGDGRQCKRPAGVRQIPCKQVPSMLADVSVQQVLLESAGVAFCPSRDCQAGTKNCSEMQSHTD